MALIVEVKGPNGEQVPLPSSYQLGDLLSFQTVDGRWWSEDAGATWTKDDG